VRLQQKDLRLALAAAAELGVALPVTAVAQELLAAVEAQGGGALGTQAIVTALERRAARRS
jgi:2-hydroxy-3-oxopropionate reductase